MAIAETPRVLKPEGRIDRAKAATILRKTINGFLERKGNRLGIPLFETDTSEDALIFDRSDFFGNPECRTIKKEELRAVWEGIKQDYGLKEITAAPKKRSEVDPKTNKVIPNFWTKYIHYSSNRPNLNFESIQKEKDKVVLSENVWIDGINTQVIVAKK